MVSFAPTILDMLAAVVNLEDMPRPIPVRAVVLIKLLLFCLLLIM